MSFDSPPPLYEEWADKGWMLIAKSIMNRGNDNLIDLNQNGSIFIGLKLK